MSTLIIAKKHTNIIMDTTNDPQEFLSPTCLNNVKHAYGAKWG